LDIFPAVDLPPTDPGVLSLATVAVFFLGVVPPGVVSVAAAAVARLAAAGLTAADLTAAAATVTPSAAASERQPGASLLAMALAAAPLSSAVTACLKRGGDKPWCGALPRVHPRLAKGI